MNNIFKNKEYESTKRVNTLPFRAHYIPFSLDQEFGFIHGIIDKTKSHKFISLNGDWQFKEHKVFTQLEDINESLDGTIYVPSCVQLKGYDYIQYTNWLYPFPFKPPFVPDDNPCFHYRKTINLTLKDNYFLVFEGVDSCFYLYINGKYVGYSQISHSKSEFDVTEYLLDGDNIIDVVVLKWCCSSYLEDQDKFRFSGIFRDVYLLNRKKENIWDYKIESVNKDGEWYFIIQNLSNYPFGVKFNGEEYRILSNEITSIKVENPIIWSNENPFLYEFVLFNNNEKILERVGLRKVHIKDSVFYINDKHIKLKGVNRHESNPITGAYVTIEDTLTDLELIKSINANAIRTSHYPCIPEFYELCDLMGIYVLTEADVESHGAVSSLYNLELWENFAKDNFFTPAVLDREMSMYERDKNKTSIIIWSLGNESNYGVIFHDGADYLKAHDSRPIHYEGIYNLVDKTDYYTDRIDIISRMYPTLEDLKTNYLVDPKEKRPLCICEYTHAMGNSCGDVRDYWELINKEDKILGAFVWEWCDHAVLVDGKLLYGSDFPERHNDGNFCVDGLVTPFRNFKSNTLEVKAIYGGKYTPDIADHKCIIKYKKPAKTNLLYRFNDELGKIDQIIINGQNVLTSPIEVLFHRAFIDNEMHIRWKLEKIVNATHKLISKEEKGNTINLSYLVSGDEDYVKYSLEYIFGDNEVHVTLDYEVLSETLPTRAGVYFSINSQEEVSFRGYGPDESYIDKCVHNTYGEHSFKVSDNLCDNLKPQESGSRYGTSYFESENIRVDAIKPFSFNIQPYSFKQLIETKHNYELKCEDKTYINLDVSMSGVGSNSCGPVLADKYSIPRKASNTFVIKFK